MILRVSSYTHIYLIIPKCDVSHLVSFFICVNENSFADHKCSKIIYTFSESLKSPLLR